MYLVSFQKREIEVEEGWYTAHGTASDKLVV